MEPNLSPALLQEIQQAFERIRDLPSPIYASDKNGAFLFANQQAVEFFRLHTPLSPGDHNIISYYEDAREREHILRRLQNATDGTWLKNLTVRLHIQGEHHKVRFVSRPFFTAQNQLAGLLCIVLSMSDIEWFSEFDEMIQAGCFEVDRQFMVADCNRTFAEILHYENPADLKGMPFGDLFWESNDGNFFTEADPHSQYKDYQFKMRRRDGAMAVVKMSWKPIADGTGAVSRIKGTIRDITSEIIQDNIPVGLFMVTTNPEGEEVVSRTNLPFVEILGSESIEDLMGKPIIDFHTNPVAYANFKKELNKAAAKNQPLLDYFTEIRNKKGEKRNIVTNARYLPGEHEKMRVGAVYDVTHHEGKHKRMLEADFSAVLHTYIATINGLRDTLTMLIKAHGQDIQKDDTHIDRVKATTESNRHKKRLGNLLEELFKTAEERDMADAQIARLKKLWRNLSAEDASATKEKESAAWARRNLIEIRKCIDDMKDLQIARELLKNVRAETEELLRLSSMVSISISVDELNERITDFYYFRDYLRRGEPLQQELKSQNLLPVLADAIEYLEEFASLNRVAIMRHFNPKENIPVLCHKTSLNRAFHNLLHNAIKYTWRKGQDRQPWVDIRIERKQDEVEITIENWGVPIRREELESGEIFQFGKRGRESEDRGRSGTGIGLYDAQDIIAKHGGALRITSEPTFGNLPNIYTNPFITKTSITLPIAKEK